MTLLESTPRPAVEPGGRAASGAVTKSTGAPGPNASRRVFATALIALAAVVVGWAAFLLFEGPVAQTWNTTRQHQLSAQFGEDRPHTGRGVAIGILQIPRVGINVVVAEGDAPQQLRSGPGHRLGTPLPGDVGNSVVVGHRTAWGGAFRKVDAVHVGDLVEVETQPTAGARYAVFKVISIAHLGPDDRAPFGTSTDHRLTIVTGSGGRFSDGRIVIVAVSGTVGKLKPAAPGVLAVAPTGSRLWNAYMLLALFGIVGGLLIALAIRRRYRPAIVAAVVTPLVVLGVLGLCLNLDLFLPPLR